MPGERATILGRVYVTDQANNVVLQQLDLDGYNHARLPSPTVNGDNVVFRDNDVTNRHTSICFLLGSREWGRARGTVIERNRIHNCGQLPPTNHHHGIYAEATDNARITDNWIYDNADRGVQMFPDAQRTYVARNVIDGNGEGVVFSRTSANNVVEKNIISNPVVRYTLEDFELTGRGNVARRNCLWSTRHVGNPAGLPAALAVPAVESIIVDPGYLNRAAKDFRLVPWSPCINFPLIPATAPVATRKKLKRPVRLWATRLVVYPGGRVRLRAQIPADSAQGAPRRALLKMRRDGLWRRVEVMRLEQDHLRDDRGPRKADRMATLRTGACVERPAHAAAARVREGSGLLEPRGPEARGVVLADLSGGERGGCARVAPQQITTRGVKEMADSVYRVTQVIGSSSESWEAAARQAVETAAQTVRDLRVAEVVRQDVTIENGKIVNYRVRLDLSFKYESSN